MSNNVAHHLVNGLCDFVNGGDELFLVPANTDLDVFNQIISRDSVSKCQEFTLSSSHLSDQ